MLSNFPGLIEINSSYVVNKAVIRNKGCTIAGTRLNLLAATSVWRIKDLKWTGMRLEIRNTSASSVTPIKWRSCSARTTSMDQSPCSRSSWVATDAWTNQALTGVLSRKDRKMIFVLLYIKTMRKREIQRHNQRKLSLLPIHKPKELWLPSIPSPHARHASEELKEAA